MSKLTRVLTALLASLFMVASAAVLAGPASAAPSTTAAHHAAARPHQPCGRKHYPPCPPKPIVHSGPHNPHRGKGVKISVQHYAAHRPVVVHLVGHHRYIKLGSVKTNKNGNLVFVVRIPKNIPTGHYTLVVKIGSKVRRLHITVRR